MKFFIDFEATQPGNEIIAVGVVSENGDTFKRFIKPQFSELTGYITQLTGIRKTDVDGAASAEEVFSDLHDWCFKKSNYQISTDWNFYAYGNADSNFLKASLKSVKKPTIILFMCYLATTLEDYSKKAEAYFQGNVSLIKAFNYVDDVNKKQTHDPLEDALMLKEVFDKINNAMPLEESPFEDVVKQRALAMPSKPNGVFWCYKKGKKQKTIIFFEDCDKAVDWVIKTTINPAMRDSVHRDKMMLKIMKAVRTKTQYNNLLWGRDKNFTIEELKKMI